MADALAALSYDVQVHYVKEPTQEPRALRGRATAVYLTGDAWPGGLLSGPSTVSGTQAVPLVIAEVDALSWASKRILTAQDFVIWPCEMSELALRLQRALPSASADLSEDDKRLRAEFAASGLIGRSPEFLSMLKLARGLTACDAPTLICGETGTGKELVARAIHLMGPRAKGPFIPVNCGALPESLVENELFGHESGAYTDAKKAQPGLVAQASGGTILLDEIEALSLKGQVALLRFLEDFRYRPLGGGRTARSDVKVIAATNVDLKELVQTGAFRSDLLYRLDVLSLVLPPLRDRQDDIELLATHFIAQLSAQYGQPPKRLRGQALDWLVNHSWPGNVRELENLIHRSIVTSPGSDLDLFHARSMNGGSAEPRTLMNGHDPCRARTFQEAKDRFVTEFERDYLIDVMEKAGGNVTQAARLAGKERRALGKLLRKHAIASDDFAGH